MNEAHYTRLRNDGNTPVRRMGLSRKRKKLYIGQKGGTNSPKEDNILVKVCKNISSHEIKYTNEGSLDEKTTISEDETKDGHSKLEPSESNLKEMNQIKDLQNLYSLWRNGCKNALLYLMKLVEQKTGEVVDINKLLQDLKIWHVISSHFADDSDLEIDC